MEEYHSGSTIQEFSLLRITNFFPLLKSNACLPLNIVYLGSLYGI